MSPSRKVTPRQTRRAATQPTTIARADSEGELGVVTGRPIPDVTTDGALCHVFGHVAADDVSARDVQAAENSGRAAGLGHQPAAGPADGGTGRWRGRPHRRPGTPDCGPRPRAGEHPFSDAVEAHIRNGFWTPRQFSYFSGRRTRCEPVRNPEAIASLIKSGQPRSTAARSCTIGRRTRRYMPRSEALWTSKRHRFPS
ncbi:fumarylacetoacetate hydrolase family protein [Streptomyces sp. NPDC056660]|uniref:fumarylacetoacetate hydrolase family protein n=1 Tax=Streptomyces sp. NPDC056660 TaxID=3345897 RepID=UPI0036AE82AB